MSSVKSSLILGPSITSALVLMHCISFPSRGVHLKSKIRGSVLMSSIDSRDLEISPWWYVACIRKPRREGRSGLQEMWVRVLYESGIQGAYELRGVWDVDVRR